MFRTKTIHADAQFPGLNVQYTGNAMPSRPAKQTARNLTGLYLGTDGEKEMLKSGDHLMTSLGRGRGMPSHKIRTPTEERRYLTLFHHYDCHYLAPHLTALHRHVNIPNLPAMPRSRYPLISPQKKVELLRIKEEKRGFTGNLLKKRQMIVEPDSNETYHRHAFYESQHPITFWDITRQTPRKFTAANNSGVTHLEYLSAEHNNLVASKEASNYVVETMAKEIQEAAVDQKDIGGVIECYNRICRGNVEALFSLLPPKPTVVQQKSQGDYKRTGFSVKSYRNPNKAEIMASFPEGDERPKTVLGTTTRSQVPSPYFYKNYDQPKTAMDRYRDISYTPFSDEPRVQGAPGTGQLSRSVSHGRQITSPGANTPLGSDILNPVLKQPQETEVPAPATTPRQGSVVEAGDIEPVVQENTAAISVPGVSEDLKSVDGIESSAENNSNNNAALPSAGLVDPQVILKPDPDKGDTEETSSSLGSSITSARGDVEGTEETDSHAQDMTQSAAGNRLEKMPSGTDIIIGVEDEQGQLKPVEIDETDDQLDDEVSSNGSVRRKVSITERILKSKNSEEQAAHLQQDASNRKKQLEELLDEHAQLVQEVDSMTDGGEQQENKENQP